MGNKKKHYVGIDLGTSNLLIYVEGQGTLFNEPSVIAVDNKTQQVVAVGFEAARLIGKTHSQVRIIRPLQGGTITDIKMIEKLLSYTLEKIFISEMNLVDKLLICIPSRITETEKNAIKELGHSLGIANTSIDEEIKAAAIGSGLDIFVPKGVMVVDIGGGTTDIGLLSLGEVVSSTSIKVAGDYFDRRIIEYIKSERKLEIGNQTAEKIKIALSSLTGAYPVDEDGQKIVYSSMGRAVEGGLPQKITIEAPEIRKILLDCFESIKIALLSILESAPPELAGDLVDTGILVTGGCSQILGVVDYLQNIAQVPVFLSEVPMTAVVDGCKKLLKITSKHYFGEVK